MRNSKDAVLLHLYSRLQIFNNQRHLYSIRTAFITCMPILIIGALATVINNLPIAAYQTFMQKYLGDLWVLFGDLAFYGTTQIVTLMLCFIISNNLASWYRRNRGWSTPGGVVGALSMACYIIMSLAYKEPSGLSFTITGVPGLFIALVIAILSTEVFLRLYSRSRVHTVWGEDPNPALPRSFSAIFPAIIVIALFSALRTCMVFFGIEEGLTELFYNFLSLPYKNISNSYSNGLIFNFFCHIMWWFGIHGNNAMDEVAKTVFVPLMEQNILLRSMGESGGHIVTKSMFDTFVYLGGAGATLGLVAAKLLFGRRSSQNNLMRFSVPTAIFNVNEPLIFGLPIVLNPLYIIPFVLTPIVNYTVAYLAMSWNLVPVVSYEVSWATPVFISGYAATGSVAAIFLQLAILVLDAIIYMPFVKMSDKLSQFRFDKAYEDLCQMILSDYNPTRKVIDRDDELGTAARHIANHMETAVRQNEMYMVYQPVVNAVTGEIHSVEALLRWQHADCGMINPFVAISLAEETGRIHILGLWIMEQAVKQRAQWTKEGLPDFQVSINFSSSQLHDPSLHKKFRQIMDKYGVPYHQIQIEITETTALVENDSTINNLKNLHELGCTIAMDDFGVGNSSLTYLRSHPISTLKIDASLSREVEKNPTNRDIIAMILQLCESLRVKTIVEFVDNKAQLDCLLEQGAVYIQGYYFSKPLKPADIQSFIEQSKGVS